mmetsp:Transcript_87895/g.277894  ORF Transcript_87895/g.277894 Transcript_87895/m.277894 type:complete len:197 (-) Transcript_87895:71-661(-)
MAAGELAAAVSGAFGRGDFANAFGEMAAGVEASAASGGVGREEFANAFSEMAASLGAEAASGNVSRKDFAKAFGEAAAGLTESARSSAYESGVEVWVWSYSEGGWCRGRVRSVEDGLVTSEYRLALGGTMINALKEGDSCLRLVGAAPLAGVPAADLSQRPAIHLDVQGCLQRWTSLIERLGLIAERLDALEARFR